MAKQTKTKPAVKRPGRPVRITEDQIRVKIKALHLFINTFIEQEAKEHPGRPLMRFKGMQRQLKIMIRKLESKFKTP